MCARGLWLELLTSWAGGLGARCSGASLVVWLEWRLAWAGAGAGLSTLRGSWLEAAGESATSLVWPPGLCRRGCVGWAAGRWVQGLPWQGVWGGGGWDQWFPECSEHEVHGTAVSQCAPCPCHTCMLSREGWAIWGPLGGAVDPGEARNPWLTEVTGQRG